MVSTVSAVMGVGAATAYLTGAFLQYRSFSESTEARTPLLIALATAGAVLHASADFHMIATNTGLNLGLSSSASLVSWIMLVSVLLAATRLPVLNLLMLIQPLAAAGVIAALIWGGSPATVIPLATLGGALLGHIALSIAAYSILFMAACQSVLVALLEHRLHRKKTIRLLRVLPPLQTMETLLFNLLWAGICVLTLAILSGFLFLEDMFAQRVAHHTLLALASWGVYAALLAGHRLFGWRGATAVRWTLLAFALLVLGYFGSKFVIEVLLEH
ncbi:MAG: cytochrome c biogenesis protein CcsA [Pseudomonadales bacterium]